ncbi:MAG: hypothetical protein LC796_12150, partial [Acidobacteria bacterium]|nr:hypothetical protein [Acidobacteriota bacterium]MCA1612241.1 hypothetical protein [Acidobacteriota bacterium]
TVGGGTLARVPLTGGAPREILEDVNGADWSPDGRTLAVLRPAGGQTILEYPIGRRLYSSANELRGPWVSPDGKSVLVAEGSPSGDRLNLVDANGAHRTLTEGWLFIDTASWHRSGQEVWFVGLNPATGVAMRAVDLAGKARIVAPLTDIEVLHDVGRDGQVLVEREIGTREIFFSSNGEPERNLSWLDQSNAKALSADGRVILSYENGEGGGERGSVYLRRTDGSPAVRLGDGEANDLSPDGKWALSLVPGAAPHLVLLPTGAGEPRVLDVGPRQVLGGLFLPPDGRRLAIAAVEPKRGARGYVLEPGAPLRSSTPEGLTGAGPASPGGDRVILKGSDEKWAIYPIAGGAPRALPGLESKDHIIQWSADGETLYVTRFGDLPLEIFRYRISTGTKETWKKIIPADRAGLVRIENVVITRDGKSYAYSHNRVLASDLFVVSGWK